MRSMGLHDTEHTACIQPCMPITQRAVRTGARGQGQRPMWCTAAPSFAADTRPTPWQNPGARAHLLHEAAVPRVGAEAHRHDRLRHRHACLRDENLLLRQPTEKLVGKQAGDILSQVNCRTQIRQCIPRLLDCTGELGVHDLRRDRP